MVAQLVRVATSQLNPELVVLSVEFCTVFMWLSFGLFLTSKKHAGRWLNYDKLPLVVSEFMNVCVCVLALPHNLFLTHSSVLVLSQQYQHVRWLGAVHALFYKAPFQIHKLHWYLQLEKPKTPPFPNPERSRIKWKVLTFKGRHHKTRHYASQGQRVTTPKWTCTG